MERDRESRTQKGSNCVGTSDVGETQANPQGGGKGDQRGIMSPPPSACYPSNVCKKVGSEEDVSSSATRRCIIGAQRPSPCTSTLTGGHVAALHHHSQKDGYIKKVTAPGGVIHLGGASRIRANGLQQHPRS